MKGHWVGKLDRSNEHIVLNGFQTTFARAVRRVPVEDQWNWGSLMKIKAIPSQMKMTDPSFRTVVKHLKRPLLKLIFRQRIKPNLVLIPN